MKESGDRGVKVVDEGEWGMGGIERGKDLCDVVCLMMGGTFTSVIVRPAR